MSESNDKYGLTPVMEDYVKAVAMIKQQRKVVRVRDISVFLDVKPSSVHSALSNLSEKELVVHEHYGSVDLTTEGEKIAEDVIRRHNILLDFLTIVLGVDREAADNDACRMEHSLSGETVNKLTSFMEFVNICPEQETPEWIRRFKHYYRTGEIMDCNKNSIDT